MARIEWKGIYWSSAHGELDVKELLTVLKGFGPLEVLEFEKPECCRGQLSVSLAKDKSREVTLYHLEVLGSPRRGEGRAFLQWLKKIFKGGVYVEDPGILVRNASAESLLFWVKMFREGNVHAIEGEVLSLHCGMTPDEVDRIEDELRKASISRSCGVS